MTFGISLYTADGKEFFSTKSSTWSYVGSFVANAGSTAQRTFDALNIISETIIQRSFLNSVPDSQEAIIHTCERNGNVVTAFAGNVDTLVVVLAR